MASSLLFLFKIVWDQCPSPRGLSQVGTVEEALILRIQSILLYTETKAFSPKCRVVFFFFFKRLNSINYHKKYIPNLLAEYLIDFFYSQFDVSQYKPYQDTVKSCQSG